MHSDEHKAVDALKLCPIPICGPLKLKIKSVAYSS